MNKVVTSPAFATLWTDALRAAHSSMVKALTGQGGGRQNTPADPGGPGGSGAAPTPAEGM